MSLNIKSIRLDPYEIEKKPKDKNKEKDVKKSPSKNVHIMKRKEGNYYCIYLVYGNGKKELIKKIAIPKLLTDKNLKKLFDNTTKKKKPFSAPVFDNMKVLKTRTAAQKINPNSKHKETIDEIIELLNPIK